MPRKSTRNAQGGGSLRKRPDGTWEGRYTTGRNPGTGRQIQRSVYGKTQAEVRKKLQQATTALDDGIYAAPSNITVGQWLDVWLEEYCAHLKETTLYLYGLRVNKTIKPALGAVKLKGLPAPAIQKFYNNLQKGEKPLAPKSVKNIHGVLHKALQQAVELDYIKLNPSNFCKLPRIGKPDIKPLDEKNITRFLETIQGHRYEHPLIVDIFTGIRQGELIGLTWDCVDFQKGTIYLCRQLQKVNGVYKFMSLKNNKTRTISPAPFVMDTLREQRRIQNGWRLLAGSAWVNNDFVFTNELGEHLKKQTLYTQFKKVVASLGLPKTRFHDLRHTYAVSAIQSGDDIKTVQENLGHHTAAFTLDVYGHVTEKMKQDSADRMEKFIKGISISKG